MLFRSKGATLKRSAPPELVVGLGVDASTPTEWHAQTLFGRVSVIPGTQQAIKGVER
ncbi:MAG: hypothetical protein KAY65_03060 [Planctomycetes bacterium]|nr:hypothetical protein [Planctomycetota bacterium]